MIGQLLHLKVITGWYPFVTLTGRQKLWGRRGCGVLDVTLQDERDEHGDRPRGRVLQFVAPGWLSSGESREGGLNIAVLFHFGNVTDRR
jgi:hypothetical protein